MRVFSVLLFLSLCSWSSAFSQGELPVDMYSGTAQVSVPLGTIVSHELSDAVSLNYNTSGMRVQQPNGYYGMGWNLRAGGAIMREVRSLPDDWTGTSADARRGWFYSNGTTTQAADVGGFSDTADTLASTYTDEATGLSKLNGYSYNLDSEPDIFNFSFGTYSGQFVFDNQSTPVIHLIPFADLKITYTQAASPSKAILSFTITTHDGVQYVFDQLANEQRRTTKIVDTLQYNKKMFSLYDYSRYSNYVSYSAGWYLSKVISPLGASLQYTYTSFSQNNTDTLRVSIQNSTGGGYTTKNIYSDNRVSTELCLYRISAYTNGVQSGDIFQFAYDNTHSLLQTLYLEDNTSTVYRRFDVGYHSITRNFYQRFFLSCITQSNGSCSVMNPYLFSYVGDTSTPPSPDDIVTVRTPTPLSLPSPWSKSVDFWGYYNGGSNLNLFPTLYYYPLEKKSEQVRIYPIPGYTHTAYSSAGVDRTPSISWALAGSLKSIQWPLGGNTTLTYELNDYYDAVTNSTQYGGGLRIKSVVYFDALNPSGNISKHYTYTDSLGHSSGRLITRPMYALPTMRYKNPSNGGVVNKGSDWSFLMVRTDSDLSAGETTDGSYVGYKEVRVTRPGAGYARYQYLLPAAYGDLATGTWTPTLDKIVRSSNISTGAITNGGPWIFPYAANPNYNHERGMVWLKQEYTDQGIKVRQTQTYYAPLYLASAAYTVYGVDYEFLPNSSNTTYMYGKYAMITDVSKVVKQEKLTTYDVHNPSSSQMSSSTYYYGKGLHRLLTQVTSVTPDGTIYQTRMKYPLDYTTVSSPNDTTTKMINLLQTNFINGSPIEQTSLVKKPSSVLRYTGGRLTRLNDFGTSTKAFPKYSYVLNLGAPLDTASFTSSYVDATAKTFKFSTKYDRSTTVTSIDAYGNPQGSQGVSLQYSSTGWGYGNTLPAATASNADYAQVAFSDFETTTNMDFTLVTSPTPHYGAGHTGTKAFYPYASNTLSRTISKAPSNNYIFSCWANSTSTTSLTLTFKNGATTLATCTVALPITDGTTFKYVSKVIPVSSFPSTFSIQIADNALAAASADSPGLLPVIDDVSFYPTNASLTSYTYTYPYGVNAVTSGNQTGYTVYDGLGRKKLTMDRDGNIRERFTYNYPGITAPAFSANFTADAGATITDGVQSFTATTTCTDQTTTYKWRIGSGSYVPGTAHQTFTIPTNDSVTISMIAVSPAYGIDTVTHLFTPVGLQPINVILCAYGAANVNICSTDVSPTSVAPSYYCSEISAPVHATGLNIHPDISNTETIISCDWYQRYAGNAWGGSPNVSYPTLHDFDFPQVLQNDASSGYDWKVVITTRTSDGRTRSGSQIISMAITHGCPSP